MNYSAKTRSSTMGDRHFQEPWRQQQRQKAFLPHYNAPDLIAGTLALANSVTTVLSWGIDILTDIFGKIVMEPLFGTNDSPAWLLEN